MHDLSPGEGEAARSLAQLLEKVTRLQSVILRNITLDPEGVQLVTKALSDHRSLTTFNIDCLDTPGELVIENSGAFSGLLDLKVVIPQVSSLGVEEVKSLRSFLAKTSNLTSLTLDRVGGYKTLKGETERLLMDALSPQL